MTSWFLRCGTPRSIVASSIRSTECHYRRGSIACQVRLIPQPGTCVVQREAIDLPKARVPIVSEEVFQQLRLAIVEGRLAPGTRLVELDIADRLGVSKTPVREALLRLERLGLVVAR